jgi:hypothetical protein
MLKSRIISRIALTNLLLHLKLIIRKSHFKTGKVSLSYNLCFSIFKLTRIIILNLNKFKKP